ncbi:nucleoside kinase [Spirochaetia bacterium]|nr:nucleoside kinase [Spirochaetia bacterium]
MLNICNNCGQYHADKIIDPEGPYAICPECNHKIPFLQLPLLIVTGAGGTGKSTVCNSLLGKNNEAVILDSDILWREEFNKPENNYRPYFETWLRVSKNIAQSGRPVVLFGAGLGVPDNIEPCIERRYFSNIYYLGLYCSADILAARLKDRPEWRNAGNIKFIEDQIKFNDWFMQYGNKKPAIDLLDTTNVPIEKTVQDVSLWISAKLNNLA